MRILDPGCGIGILSCAVIEHVLSVCKPGCEIDLVVFENDTEIASYTQQCLDYTGEWVRKNKSHFKVYVCANDFVLHNSQLISSGAISESELFDIVITNPPYFKVGRKDYRREAAQTIVGGHNNIYSIFIELSLRLLKLDGTLAFITPRSFASGSYFKTFRRNLFSRLQVQFLHLFESRTQVFSNDGVVQENVILLGIRRDTILGRKQQPELPFDVADDQEITISVSQGLADLNTPLQRLLSMTDVLDVTSDDAMLHIPSSQRELDVINRFKSWEHDLTSLGFRVSTGPVVAFRNTESIKLRQGIGRVPLFWLHNVSKMKLCWPIQRKEKGQFIDSSLTSQKALVANTNYVFVRRFSAKDDERRLIASPYLAKDFSTWPTIGIENHLNYIRKVSGNMTQAEAFGIAGLISSSLFDEYFRTFNGNTNVSATELQRIPMPSLPAIRAIGKRVKNLTNVSQSKIDDCVAQLLKLD